MPIVNVYIDGLNLYYRSLAGTPHKWLNIAALAEAVLPNDYDIQRINYYTAHVSGRVDLDAPRRQNAFLRALGTLPNIYIYYGRFLTTEKWAGLVAPPEQQFRPTPIVAKVWKTEEKGSDVNLGVHLVRDAFQGRFEVAAVLTNDTDLEEAFRIVRQDVGLPVVLLAPVDRPAKSLVDLASSVRHIRPYLGPCHFPNPVIGRNGRHIEKPSTW